jgi:ABC-type glycerol-3-phosphate transport system permease component
MRRQNSLVEVIKNLVVIFFLFLTLVPFFIMVIKSVKNIEQNLHEPFTLSFPFHWVNYSLAWLYVNEYIINTLFITAVGTVLIVVFASMAAYVFARFTFPGKNFFFMLIIMLMMIPGILTLVPMFLLVNDMDIVDTKMAIILPGLRAQIPMAVFLTRAFIEGINKELFEAAVIDGAGTGRVFLQLVLPLIKPILATAAILCVLYFWNDLIWPSIVLQTSKNYTIAIGLKPFSASYMGNIRNYGPALAGYCIASVPLLVAFFAASKQFIAGLTSGSVKM